MNTGTLTRSSNIPSIDTIGSKLLSGIDAAVLIVSADGVISYANEQATKLSGYSSTELTDKPIYNLLEEGCLNELLQHQKSKATITLYKKEKSTCTCSVQSLPLDNGEYCLIIDDITEQIAQNNKLADLSAAVAAAMDGIALLDQEGKYYYLNEKHITYFGYTHESQLLGKTWHIFYPEEEIQRIELDLFPKLARDGRWQGETVGRKLDGSPINQEITLTTLPHGGLICIMRNITEKKLQEHEFKKLALVSRKTDNAVVITEGGLTIEWMNDACMSMFSITPEQMHGTNIFDFFGSLEIYDSKLNEIKDAMCRNEPTKIELLTLNPYGKKQWLQLEVCPMVEKNSVKNFAFLFVDITTIKEAEENLLSTLVKEKALNNLKDHFVNLTSHEFRTPLASIQSSLDILKMYTDKGIEIPQSKMQQHLAQIEDETDRMTELMDNVLMIGKINSGKIDFRPKKQDLIPLLNIITDEKNFIKYNGTLTLTITGSVRDITFDSRLLNHTLLNLTHNAFKYSQASGVAPELHVHFGETDTMFEIIDHGIGIPAEDEKNIFESFFRASNTGNIPGTGLGLTIVKQFVELHGGTINFESTPNQRTAFKFNIPLHK